MILNVWWSFSSSLFRVFRAHHILVLRIRILLGKLRKLRQRINGIFNTALSHSPETAAGPSPRAPTEQLTRATRQKWISCYRIRMHMAMHNAMAFLLFLFLSNFMYSKFASCIRVHGKYEITLWNWKQKQPKHTKHIRYLWVRCSSSSQWHSVQFTKWNE